ncbi:MAG: hypothetical protein RLZZ618_2553 [Pseudomonadota bacterium]
MTAHPHSPEQLRERYGDKHRWLVLLTVMLGTMASIMASTIVNVAVPAMSHQFALGQERAQWLSAGFMAAMTISMLLTPWLLDRFGFRRTYAAAVLILMLGGIGGGFGWRFDWVLAMRVVEGLAAGVLQPIPAILIMQTFSRGQQGRAMGVFGFGVVLAPAIGPSIGGVLVDVFGWRSIFFVVVPFCIVALELARRYLPHSSPSGAVNHQPRRIDLPGLMLLTVAVLTGLNGLVHLHDESKLLALGLLVSSAMATTAFIIHQRRTPHPLMQLSLFTVRQFSWGGAVAFIYGMALFGSTYLVPVFMQIALKLPPTQAGAVLLPAGIVLALTIPVAGRLSDSIAVHVLVAAGVLCLAASFWLMVTVGVGTALWIITLWAVVGRIGLGVVLPSLNLGTVRVLPDKLVSYGASSINFLRQLGGAVGVSVVGIVLEWRLRVHADDPVQAFHETFALLGLTCSVAVFAAWRMQPAPVAASASA